MASGVYALVPPPLRPLCPCSPLHCYMPLPFASMPPIIWGRRAIQAQRGQPSMAGRLASPACARDSVANSLSFSRPLVVLSSFLFLAARLTAC